MQPDAAALTASSNRSAIKRLPLPLAGVDHGSVLIVLDDADDGTLRIETSPLAVAETPGRALGTDGTHEIGRRLHGSAQLLLVERTRLPDRLRDEVNAIPAIGRQAARLLFVFLDVGLDERLGLRLICVEGVDEHHAFHQVLGHREIGRNAEIVRAQDRKSTRLNSSHQIISYAVFCLKKKKTVSPD